MKKSFVIVVIPCHAGYQCGYIARWHKYQTWAKTRQEVIEDILMVIEKHYKNK